MMQTTDRPTQVSAILKDISVQYSADIGASLEAYIANLEARQQVLVAPGDAEVSTSDPENPPVWSQERAMQRERHRQERALKKWRQQNKYQ